jgi:predicted transcriptional regulator
MRFSARDRALMSKGDIVISVQSRFVERISSGRKAAELRRRAPRIQPGCRVWIYTKAPEAMISICVTVDRIITGRPEEIWQSHRSHLGVSLDEFQSYFGETETACAIFFNRVEDLSPGVALSEMRSKSKGFHPPQFFKRLREGSPELKLLRSRLSSIAM